MADTSATPSKFHQRFTIIAAIILTLAVGGYVAYDSWQVHQQTEALLKVPGIITRADADDPEKADEGSDATEVTEQDFSSYKVADDEPRLLTIDALGLTARIKPMGLNSDKSIEAPKNIYDAGWFTGSAKPGQAGAAFIDGHASGSTRYGLFGNLDKLKVGDTIGVEKGNGEKLTYKVMKVETVPLTKVDMSSVLQPYAGAKNGLNLMTCTGTWLRESATLDQRFIVYTQQV